jgi:hypothetical protein
VDGVLREKSAMAGCGLASHREALGGGGEILKLKAFIFNL